MRTSRILAACGAFAVVAGLAACSPTPAQNEPRSMRIAVDPGQLDLAFDVIDNPSAGRWWLTGQAVYDAFFEWDAAEERYVPMLAESWELTEDAFTLTLELRDDVTFNDGTRLDAEGAAAAFNAILQSPKSGFSWLYAQNEALATATGEYTLEITSTQPMLDTSFLLTELAHIPIFSPAAIDDHSIFEDGGAGSGPYLFESATPEVSATFVRDPDHWDPEGARFDELEIVVYADRVAALNALKSGQIDVTELDGSLAAEAESSGFVVAAGPGSFNEILIGDIRGALVPALGDKRVRQALAFAFDREAIVDTLLSGYGTSSTQPLEVGRNEYVEGGDDRYAYDPERARELLAEAGYPDGFVLPLPNLQIGWQTVDFMPIVEQSLADIGVTVEWVQSDPAEVYADFLAGEIPAMIYAGNGYQNPIQGRATTWAPLYAGDPGFDELMEDYRSGTVTEHAAAQPLLAEYILDQSWDIVIAHTQAIWASTPDIEVIVTHLPVNLPDLTRFRPAE